MKRFLTVLMGLIALTCIILAIVVKEYHGEMLTAYTFTLVDAPADKAWRVLTDTAAYPQWNPYIVEVDGTLQPGAKLKIEEVINGKRRSHTVHVTRFNSADRQLLWEEAWTPAKLLSWGEWFSVEPVDATHSRVVFLQSHQGMLAHIYWKYYKNRDLAAARQMGAALKKRAEQ